MKQYIEPNTAIQQMELHTFICSGGGQKMIIEGSNDPGTAQAPMRPIVH